MKKIISLILSVTMLASAAQLYASADIAPDVVQTEAVQEATAQSTTQSTTQKTTETTQSSDSGSNTDIAASGSASAYTSDESSLSTESAKIKTAVNALLKSETADEEQSGKLTLANSPMLKAQQAINLTQATDLGDTFYAAIKFRDTSAYLGVDFSSYTEHNYGDAFAESYNVVIRSNPTDQSYYWKFTSTGDGDGSYYIENILNNWRLDVNEGKSAIYTNVQLWSVANTDNSQKWKIYKDTQGRYVFTSRVTDEKTIDARVLDIAGNGWADDTNAQIYFYDPTSEADRFYLEMMSVAAQEESCKPITSDNINFQLFDYSEGINRNGGIKGINEGSTDTNNWRPLANYFSFVANPAEKLTTDPKPDAWVDNRGEYDADGFVLNHATVERKLVNNYPVIDLSRSAVSNTGDSGKKGNGDNSELPDKDDRSLAYLFGGEPDNRAVQSYSPKNTILQEYTDTNSGVKHYYYNSTVSISGTATQDLANAVDYDYNANEFRVRSYTEGGGFFPFNTTSDQGVDNSPHAFSNPDHWFGMRMDVDFIQGEGGKINGEDMIFNFTGDDDIWVFIDDVLVLDIGGRHTAVRGSINFSSGEIKAYNPAYADVCNYPTTLSKVFELAGANPIGGWSSDKKTFANYTSHKLSFFYLERAKGEATCCIDFNLPEPPTNSVQISKTVEDKNGNAVTTDNNDYTFRLCYANSDDVISDSQLLSYEKIDSNGNRVTGNLDYGEFSLKNGEWIRFTSLGDECKIKEINNPIYVKKTDVKVEGVKTAEFENVPNNTPYISVQPSATNEKTVEFINTLQSVDINFKFYNRDPATGKTADVSSTPQTFTRTVSNNEYGTLYNSNPKTDNKETYFSNIISTVGVDFSTKYSNVLDNYELFQSQSQALSTITTFKDYHSENGSNYSSQAYHTNRYGYTQSKVGEDTYIWNDPENTTADGAKWVTYKDGNGNEIAEENLSEANAGSVETIDVWLFNNPRYYYVSVYGATESSQLTTVGTKHIATANSTPYNAFYNQRFGTAIDNGGYIDSATDYLKAYGISGYIGQSVSTASAIGDLKFSYWSFDENGKTVASTDRRYNFRIKNNLTLYAVYETTPLSEKKDDSGNIVKGLSVSMNDPDLYVENGKERIRLNTEINPYNCPDQDTNIQNVAAIYVVDKYANIVMDDTVLSCIKKIVQQNIADIKQESNGSSHTGIDLSTLTGDDVIKDCDGHTLTLGKGNFYVYYVDAFVKPVDGVSNQVVLTNKNR
ncbi:MAG: fibro-slime domain-containing protein, partial [Ruminococcus sp.]